MMMMMMIIIISIIILQKSKGFCAWWWVGSCGGFCEQSRRELVFERSCVADSVKKIMQGIELRCPVLCCAVLCCAVLCCAVLPIPHTNTTCGFL